MSELLKDTLHAKNIAPITFVTEADGCFNTIKISSSNPIIKKEDIVESLRGYLQRDLIDWIIHRALDSPFNKDTLTEYTSLAKIISKYYRSTPPVFSDKLICLCTSENMVYLYRNLQCSIDGINFITSEDIRLARRLILIPIEMLNGGNANDTICVDTEIVEGVNTFKYMFKSTVSSSLCITLDRGVPCST